MAEKRKRREPDDRIVESTEVGQNQRTPAALYGRRRVAVACDLCRLRKSRCDAKKPSCSTCVTFKVTCEYRKEGLHDRDVPVAESIKALDERIQNIEKGLKQLTENGNSVRLSGHDSLPALVSGEAEEQTLGSHGGPRPSRQWNSPMALTSPGLSLSNLAATPQRPEVDRGHKMPTLFTFNSPPYLDFPSYDHLGLFLDIELEKGENVSNALNSSISFFDHDIDVSNRRCTVLQHSFAENVLRWIPLLDQVTISKHFLNCTMSAFHVEDSSTCLVMFILALGALAEDKSTLYCEQFDSLAGFDYFARGYKILQTLPSPGRDITVIQCRILVASFYLLAMRPLQAWTAIVQASRDCIILLKTNWQADPNFKSQMERAFWILYVLENELEVCLELPPTGIRAYEAKVDLPTSRYDEDGLYYHLAFASLRKLMMEVVDTIGFESGAVIYAPVVVFELRKQLQDWYDHLPASLKFPLDATTIFNAQKEHLRGQYYALLAVTSWPFVLRCLGNEGVDTAEKTCAIECMDACAIYLECSDGMLMHKRLVTHVALRGYYAVAMVLLVVYRSPLLMTLAPSGMNDLLRKALQNLYIWEEVPFLKEPLRIINEILMQSVLHGLSPTF